LSATIPGVVDFCDFLGVVMSEVDGLANNASPELGATRIGGNETSNPDATLDTSAATALTATEGAGKVTSIGPYQLIRRLGEGGMGQVWLAEQKEPIQRQVALKLIRVGIYDDAVLQRFYAERQSLAMMDHTSIAKVFDAGATPDGQPYFVMEYVPGQPLTAYCDRKRLKIRERLELFIKVCEGVQHAHQKAIMHRDLKPANILVVEVDGKPVPRIIDFGLAKAASPQLDGETLALMTRPGGWVGTPGYMSPEQADPAVMDVDTRTDVYSLGAVLYELLTGFLPFETRKQRFDEFLRRLREEDPQRPSTRVGTMKESSKATASARGAEPAQLVNSLRGDLDWITMKALEKDRDRRYGTPMDLAADIGRYLDDKPVTARPASFGYRAGKYVRRNRTAVALASLTFAALVAGITGTVIQGQRARVQRDFAFRELARAEAVNDLNDYVLSDAASVEKTFTVDDLLAGAERIVQRQQEGQGTRAELLLSLGRQYATLGKYQKARQLLEEARDLSRKVSEPSTLARASCELGQVLSRTGDVGQGEASFQEGLKELPEDPLYVVDRVTCLLRGAEVASTAGHENDALGRARAAQHLVEQSSFQSDSLKVVSLIVLALTSNSTGQRGEAVEDYHKAAALLESLGRDQTSLAGTTFNNWGTMLNRAGRPLEAERVLRRTIEIARQGPGEVSVPLTTLANYGQALYELRRLDEADRACEQAYERAKKAGDSIAVSQTLLHRARIYRAQGNLAQADAMLAEVEPLLQKSVPPGHIAFAILAIDKALNAQARGDNVKAMTLARQTTDMMGALAKKGRASADYQGKALVGISGIELQAGNPEEALSDAAQALPLLQKAALPGKYSADVGHAYLAQGRALEAQGKNEEARAVFRLAADNLGDALGQDHPDYLAARQLGDKAPQ
jgi:eukaryotic-like serine/threonine-protein kinase